MSNKWDRTRAALKELLNVLSCSMCNKGLHKPQQCISCGNYTCLSCVNNGRFSACIQCKLDAKNCNFVEDKTIEKIIQACCAIAEEVQFEICKNEKNDNLEVKIKDVPNDDVDDNIDVSMKDLSINNDNSNNNTTSTLTKKPVKRLKKRKAATNWRHSGSEPKLTKYNKVLENPKNINKRNPKGETLLLEACRKNRVEIVRSLLKKGADPDMSCYAGWTPLQECVDFYFVQIVEILLDKGADVNKKGFEGRTALHEAAKNNNLELVKLLLKFHAKKNILDDNQKRPIDYCTSAEAQILLSDESSINEKLEDETTLDSKNNLEEGETSNGFVRKTCNSNGIQEDHSKDVKDENDTEDIEIVFENINEPNAITDSSNILQDSINDSRKPTNPKNSIASKDIPNINYDLNVNLTSSPKRKSSINNCKDIIKNSFLNINKSCASVDSEEFIDVIN